jgi:hypothetical protein
MDSLTAFGLLPVTAMLVAYALEDRSPWFTLAFGGACVLGSVYGSGTPLRRQAEWGK